MKRIIWLLGTLSCLLLSTVIVDNTVLRYDLTKLFVHRILQESENYNFYYQIYGEYPLSDKELCDNYKIGFEDYPDSIVVLNDYKNLSAKYADSIDWSWSYFYYNSIDPLSKEKNTWIYFPIYDRETKRRENFIILSAGVDGKQDNFLNINDTLYMDDFDMKLKLYNNPAMTVKINNNFYRGYECNIQFPNNIFIRLFGKKDYLVSVNSYTKNKDIKKYTRDNTPHDN